METTGIFMSNTESYIYQIINKYLCGKLYRNEAARLLQVTERTISRYSKRVKELGMHGVKHGNCGKRPRQKYSQELKLQVMSLFKKRYFDFNLTHFSEILEKSHNTSIKYGTLWKWFRAENLIKHTYHKRRKKHVYRDRRKRYKITSLLMPST